MPIILSACQSLPTTPHLPKSLAITQKIHQNYATPQSTSQHNGLTTAITEQLYSHPKLSGYYPIATGANAFAARSILTDMASHTIDVQYYIWHNDEAGQLMLKDLWEAAERGVLVRLLIDDFNGTPSLDALLARFATHPNIAVRVMNPMPYRHFRPANFLTHPLRTNRRMHNKSMTFDNRLSIIGGRNIGNEYLNNHDSTNFADLDVLLIGEIVPSITKSFEDYWQSPLAYDIETLAKPSKKVDNSAFTLAKDDSDNKANATKDEQALKTYRQAVMDSTIGNDLLTKKIPFRWARIDLVADNAKKLQKTATNDELLITQLQSHFGTPKQKFSIISSYFVPTKDGVKGLIALQKQGVTVQILTNSYDATDVGTVHSGYAYWRADLLKAGVRLFELKATAVRGTPATDKKFLSGSSASASSDEKGNNRLWRTKGQTTTSLHAKAFAVDDHKVFIGSYNVDPRSANINSEMGVLIYDTLLAKKMHTAFNDKLLQQAYEVKLNNGKLEWHTIQDGKTVILHQEPNMTFNDKIAIGALSLLPIDGLL